MQVLLKQMLTVTRLEAAPVPVDSNLLDALDDGADAPLVILARRS